MNHNDNLSQYANEIPKEIKLVIKGLDSEVRLAIIVALMENRKMTFSELKQSLGLSSSSLSSHLSILQDGGLVNNILEWNEKSYSYYLITDIAKTVLESLFDTVVQIPTTISASKTINPEGLFEVLEQAPISNKQIIESSFLHLALERDFATDAINSVPQYATIDNNYMRRFQNKQENG